MTMPLRSGVTAPSFASAMSPGLRVRRCAKFRKLAELAGFVWDCTEYAAVVVEARRQRARRGEADRGCAARSRAALEHTGVVSKTNMDLAVLRGLIDAG